MKIPYLEPIIPGMFLLPGENDARFPFSHSVVIKNTECDVLIDAGCGNKRLRKVIEKWSPEIAVVSHSHPDHCSGLWLLPDTRIMIPFQHSDIFWRFEPMGRRFVEAGTLAATWINFVREAMEIQETSPDECFGDGDGLHFGKLKLECIHSPGHTNDSYIFFEPKNGVALTFDIDLTSFGPWYGHRESDIDAFLNSINVVKQLNPKIVVSSHKGIIKSEIPERLEKYASIVDARDQTILSLLDHPKSLDQLVDYSPIFGRYPVIPELLRYWESNMVEKHLDRLARRGLVCFNDDVWLRT